MTLFLDSPALLSLCCSLLNVRQFLLLLGSTVRNNRLLPLFSVPGGHCGPSLPPVISRRFVCSVSVSTCHLHQALHVCFPKMSLHFSICFNWGVSHRPDILLICVGPVTVPSLHARFVSSNEAFEISCRPITNFIHMLLFKDFVTFIDV